MSGNKIILGIGNQLGGDDAVGAFVARRINKKLRKNAPTSPPTASDQPDMISIDAGTAPENYTSVIRKHRPALLILVDAADMGLPAGSIRIIPPDKIQTVSFSTHHMPLSTFFTYVREFCGQAYLIGIQPKFTEIGKRLSSNLRKSGQHVADLIFEGRWNEIQILE